jgi:hypothetical protein
MRGGGFSERDLASERPARVSLPAKIPRLDAEVIGLLTEIEGFEGSDDLLRAARLAAAMQMLARSGFKLTLLPIEAAAPIERATRRRWRR